MNPAVAARLAWPDVLERIRSSGFFVTLMTTVWVGSLVYAGNIQMWTAGFRGVVNAAWLGTVMALSATTFVSFAGFYVVKNAVERDRRTGVGQIVAATPVSTATYLLAKWLSNFLVLAAVVAGLAVAAVGLLVITSGLARLDLGALLAPIVLLALPGMAVVAACAVVFESVPALAGGGGNVVYFFVWSALLSVPLLTRSPWFDWGGLTFVERSLSAAVQAVAPDTAVRLSFAAGPVRNLSQFKPLEWGGIAWTASDVLSRLLWIPVSALAVLCTSAWFNRFDTTAASSEGRGVRWWRSSSTSAASPTPLTGSGTQARGRRWWRPSQTAGARRLDAWRFVERLAPERAVLWSMVVAELRLAFSDVGRPWVFVAVVLWAVTLALPPSAGRFVQAAVAIWPALLWSTMGVRERIHRTEALVFSAPEPMRRQFLALWLAGVAIALAVGSGFAVRLGVSGEVGALVTWLAGAALVPSLALALGVWTRSPRAFEALYTVWWYIGPLNGVAFFDHTGGRMIGTPLAQTPALTWVVMAAVLITVAVVGRQRQMR